VGAAQRVLAKLDGARYKAPMNDYLRQRIRERQAQIADLKRQLDLANAELRAYEDALDHSEGEPAKASGNGVGYPPSDARRLPPQPPSHWPGIIATLARRGETFTTDDVMQELANLGKTIERKSARSKLTELVKSGKVIRLSDGVFTVPGRMEDSAGEHAEAK
jgi:hypothetical protein